MLSGADGGGQLAAIHDVSVLPEDEEAQGPKASATRDNR